MPMSYYESNHVLNIADNLVTGGGRIEHIALRRNDEVDRNALGTVRITELTTAGNFARCFNESDILDLWATRPVSARSS